MDNIDLTRELQNEYVEMHELVVKAKYYFLKVLQSATVADDKKNKLRDKLIEIAEEIKTRHNRIRYAKINNYNLN
jgi:GMP synthase PP-ATPase subunit